MCLILCQQIRQKYKFLLNVKRTQRIQGKVARPKECLGSISFIVEFTHLLFIGLYSWIESDLLSLYFF